jgi:galactofuranose transport system substrate-binding protein
MKRVKWITLGMVLASLACQLSGTAGQVQTQVAATIQAGQSSTAQAAATPEPSSTPAGTAVPTKAMPNPPTKTPAKNYKNLNVGYVEGCHSGSAWGNAFIASITDTANQLGVNLKYINSNCNLNSQLAALRDLITAKVDIIGFSAVPSGTPADWDAIISSAHAADIPILILDQIGEAGNSAYSSYLRVDYMEQGRVAAQALANVMNEKGNVVLIPGPQGITASDDRMNGFREGIQAYPNIKLIDTMNGDWSANSGYTVMAQFLKAEGGQINGAFFANDDMALGGIQAIKAANKKPGADIKIVSVDGSRAAFLALIAGDLNATVETSPSFGPPFFEAALSAIKGGILPREIIIPATVYFQDGAQAMLPTRKW